MRGFSGKKGKNQKFNSPKKGRKLTSGEETRKEVNEVEEQTTGQN